MAVNLLKWARGVEEQLFHAMVLDDADVTVQRELRTLDRIGVQNDLETQAENFLLTLEHWLHERDDKKPEDQAEMSILLIVDINIPDLQNLASLNHLGLSDCLKDIPNDHLETGNGRWAGLVLVDSILRRDPRFRDLPVIMVSGFGTVGGEARLKQLEAQQVRVPRQCGPIAYVDKAAHTAGSGASTRFKRFAEEFVHDKRLYFMQRLAEFWRLDEAQVCGMMGLREHEGRRIAELFDRGRHSLTTDHDSRYRSLKRTQNLLGNLLRTRKAQIEWLNTPATDLERQKPIDLLCCGDADKFYSIEGYVSFLCQR